MSAIPSAWMPAAKMQRVICHWTAGRHKATALDKKHYHILIEGDGTVVKGDPSIALNESPAKLGYAAHTLNCNSGSIGVSMCGMWNAKENPFDAGPAPLTAVQWDKMVQCVAELCTRYNIPVTPQTVLSHAEVQINLGIKQRGKWDFTRLPFAPSVVGAKACGEKLRRDVTAAKMLGADPTTPVISHKVVSGDTWYSVARRYGLSLDTLLRWNDAHAGETLVVGRVLRLTGRVLPPSTDNAVRETFAEKVVVSEPLPHPEPVKPTGWAAFFAAIIQLFRRPA